jgi:hypothetical protein
MISKANTEMKDLLHVLARRVSMISSDSEPRCKGLEYKVTLVTGDFYALCVCSC